MSKLRPREEYEKTKSFRFFRWLSAQEDPYIGNIEMKKQEIFQEEDAIIQERILERERIISRIYDVENNKKIRVFDHFYNTMSTIFCILIVAILIATVTFLPAHGEANSPTNNEVTQKYILDAKNDTGALNIVTGMILDYRAFDTLGEAYVLFISTITIMILLKTGNSDNHGKGMWTTEESEANDRVYEPKNDIILQKVAFFLVPIIMIFGIYVILNGHLSPGGGFSGGAIMGSGLILYLNAFGFIKTERFFTEKTFKLVVLYTLTAYSALKSYSFYTGANHIESIIPLGTPGAILSSGLILFLNIGIGLIVACTMYAFYALFRKGGF